jgi:hypothetical protein
MTKENKRMKKAVSKKETESEKPITEQELASYSEILNTSMIEFEVETGNTIRVIDSITRQIDCMLRVLNTEKASDCHALAVDKITELIKSYSISKGADNENNEDGDKEDRPTE